ncbi:MAG: DUF262 domain-containing protein [Leptospiraceae bacterium]|nr:DUF262 domain-containing protein [Leptospiraceae bacterium]
MRENILFLKSINQLFENSFFIPSYQRGYRWTELQVTQLLDDIWEFVINPPNHEEGKQNPFYCLQPIVVKQHGNNQSEWEVIDGQQRLTTIYIILKNLETIIERDTKNFNRLFYETREGSESYLKNIEEEKSKNNIDFYHIYQANKTVQNWFKNKANKTEFASPKAKFTPTFLTDTKVIWYEVNDGSDSYELFTRLNIGKIQLTNAELIKALFLKRWNNKEAIDNLRLKQLQIASEWDRIENTLQDDSFWYFIYNKNNKKGKGKDNIKYANRIEYIFDLMKNKKKDDEDKYTFFNFYQEFEKSIREKKIPDAGAIWLEVKKYFLIFEEWYKDRMLYHLIGFLITTGSDIQELINARIGKSKTDFRQTLINEIKGKLKCNIGELEYGDPLTKDILLLFNIQTILSNIKSNMRFPFDLYKNSSGWDVEHVRSQTEKDIKNLKDRKEWARDILEYFTAIKGFSDNIVHGSDKTEMQLQIEYINKMNAEKKEYCERLIRILNNEKIEDSMFNMLYDDLTKYFGEDKPHEDINTISNLALLDPHTNRSYKNAMFPIKRKAILENDKHGVFTPICTKNVFMKAYSSHFDEIMYWNKDDADSYLRAIEDTLSIYLPNESRDNGN